MLSIFELSSAQSARISAVAGALIVTAIMMSAAIVPASPSVALTIGALA